MENIINNPLVSLLIPCYNVERKAFRLFDSILKQTYNHFQLVVVNDGSTDGTEGLIKTYKDRFESIGIEFIYIKQENAGVAKACENGLKYVKGEYLCWPDSDDFYHPNCIEKLLFYLINNPSCNLVRCNANIYYEDNLNKSIGTLAVMDDEMFREDNLIRNYILENNVSFAPICYMMRFTAFKKLNPALVLYDSRTGQNYQMMLPLLYKSKCGYIDECLCAYLVFKNSHSHIYDYNSSYDLRIKRIESKHDCVCGTLRSMQVNLEEYDEYVSIAYQKLNAEKCLAAYDYGMKSQYKQLRPIVTDEFYVRKLRRADSLIKIPFAFKFHYLLVRLKQIIKNQDRLFFLLKRINNLYKHR